MKAYVFEGTPEEVVQAVKAIQGQSLPPEELKTQELFQQIAIDSDNSSDAPTTSESERVYVTTETARKIFSRRPLSVEQKSILKLLADKYPEWTYIEDMQKHIGYTPSQLAGLLGAFGRRQAHTEGFVPGSWLFDTHWDIYEGSMMYKLPETVYNAVILENIS